VADLGREVFGALRGAIENNERLVEIAFLDEVLAHTLTDMLVHFI
jgi:hypothetical protein